MSKKLDIYEIRTEYGLSQVEFADALGVSVSSISNIESGRTELSTRMQGRILRFLDLQKQMYDEKYIFDAIYYLYIKNGLSSTQSVEMVEYMKNIINSDGIEDGKKKTYLEFAMEVFKEFNSICALKKQSMILDKPVDYQKELNKSFNAILKKAVNDK